MLAVRLETELKHDVEVFKDKLLNNSTLDDSVLSLVCWSLSNNSRARKYDNVNWHEEAHMEIHFFYLGSVDTRLPTPPVFRTDHTYNTYLVQIQTERHGWQ